MNAADLAVIIPTRDRWPVLAGTLAALANQTESGFETVVAVDGDDQIVPDLGGAKVVVAPRGGPGATRNAAVAALDARHRPLLLFLGDDMVPAPDLVARHLERHRAEPDHRVAVLGDVVWHPDVARGRLARWLEWSGTQFDYRRLRAEQRDTERRGAERPVEAGFGRFYSCNVSLKRSLFDRVGGFDGAFTYYYEDLDLGWRLAEAGLRLLYEPAALTAHLHRYDWPAVERRIRGIAVGERRMATKHDWFEPFYGARLRAAAVYRPVSPVWTHAVDALPERWAAPGRGGWRARARRSLEWRADTWYHQQLADPFFDAWAAEVDLAELKEYLGPAFDLSVLEHHRDAVEREEAAAADVEDFYRTSETYLYDLTAFAMSGTKVPYRRDLRRLVPEGARLLDYGCGIGSDGLRLLDAGYAVEFADYDNPSTRYLRWRLARRGLDAVVHDIEGDVPGGFDAAYCFDVLEHVEDAFAVLAALEQRAEIVVVNLLEPDPTDTAVHRPLPIGAIVDHAQRRGLLRYRIYHQRSHLVAYRGTAASGSPGRRLASAGERRLGPLLARRPGIGQLRRATSR